MLTTLLIALPLAAALLVWLLPLSTESTAGLAVLAVLAEVGLWAGSVVPLNIVTFGLVDTGSRFDFGASVPQFSQERVWFEEFDIAYSVGLYGFQLWLVGLTAVIGACAIGYGAWAGRERPRAYFGLMLFLVGSLVGVFASQDLVLFYVFFEAMLIPLYVLVGVWGGERRVRATVTFVIYTMAGSLLMLAAIVAFGVEQGTFSLAEAGTSDSTWIFLGFLVAFCVKAPLLPFHGWLRLAYTEAPPEVGALLSGVVSKAAVFGLIWIVLPHFPGPVADWRQVVLALAAATLVYGSLLAFRQPDARSVIAYSSMGQMGLIVLGVFAANDLGLDGAILHSVSHGLVSAALFLLAATIETRTGSGAFDRLGGMARGHPVLATLVLATGVCALAVPGSANFAGEFAILAGVLEHGWGWAAVGAGAIVLAALYALRFISAILHETRGVAVPTERKDLDANELWLIVPLVAALAALSLWPAAVSERSFPTDGIAAITGEETE
ncbi:MAG: NADH-quinone oxidoreductase subunit M [Thermoleophilia bacterium]|nr:NADH-quinone oxidoreductase subunit M [Thermoleophilia bacterium]